MTHETWGGTDRPTNGKFFDLEFAKVLFAVYQTTP